MADGFPEASLTRARTALLLAYPGFTALDLFGPQYFLAAIPGMVLQVVAGTIEPVRGDVGTCILPACDFTTAPKACDILLVPGGGPGAVAAMQNLEILEFLRSRAAGAKIVAGLCTGVLILGAAGLLRGRRATSHWLVRDRLLPQLEATPVAERVVEDGTDLITAAGVTAGLDLGLTMVRRLMGVDYATKLELLAEIRSNTVPASNQAVSGLQDMFAPLVAQAEAACNVARTQWLSLSSVA